MPDSLLAQLPYYLCGFASLMSAALLVLRVMRRTLPVSRLLEAAAFLMLGAAFSLLVITAGPAPVVSRAEMVSVIRWVFLSAGVLWCARLLVDIRQSTRERGTGI